MVSIPLENFWKYLPFLTSGSCWAAPSHLMKQWVFMANWFTFPVSYHSSILFCRALQTSLPYSDHLEQSSKFPFFDSRSLLDPFSDPRHPKLNASDITSYSRSAMVGWCQHNIWHQCCNSKLLGNLEVVTRFPAGPEAAVWHWLGRGCSNRAWLMSCHPLDLFNTLVYSHCMFLVCSNNLGVVSVTNKGHTCSTKTNCTLRHIYLLQAYHYIWLWVIHVPGCNNISNTLSREDVTGFLKGFLSTLGQASIPLLIQFTNKLIFRKCQHWWTHHSYD